MASLLAIAATRVAVAARTGSTGGDGGAWLDADVCRRYRHGRQTERGRHRRGRPGQRSLLQHRPVRHGSAAVHGPAGRQIVWGRQPEDCHHTLHQGIFLSVVFTVPLMALTYALPSLLFRWDVNPFTAAATGPFIRVLSWGTLPLLLYACLRRYLQAMKLVRPVMFALVSANLVNWLGNWALIYGHLGFRAYGIEGSA